MALQPNQVSDIVTSQLGRPATDFETALHANSSVQDLANLKDTHAKLNPNSIVDYLTSVGQDPSIQNRTALGAKYGITNIGTAEGNTALLNALKSGKPPATPVVPPVVGSVKDATTTVPPDSTITPPATDTTISPIDTTSTDNTLTGSISGATGDTSGNPPAIPGLSDAKNAYTTSQQAVADVSSQISDINNAINSSLQNKRDEIARSGGVVDESQLKSTVLAENAPLIAERNNLQTQRAQLVSEQSIAGKNYQDLLNQQKESDANFYKSATEADKQVTLAQGQEKIDAQQQQFIQKLETSGWKSVSVTSYDEYGNVVGKSNVWTQNPGAKTALDSNGNTVSLSTDAKGNTISKPVTSAGTSTKTPNNPDIVSSSTKTPTSAPLNTSPTVDITKPGYTTATVMFGGKDTQLTQSYIDQIAIAAVVNGGQIPVGSVRGTKGLPMVQTNAIKARIGQLDPGGNLALNKAEATAWASALTTQIGYVTNLNAALQSADADFKETLTTFKDKGINNSIPISNVIQNATKYGLGNTDVAAFKASLSEISRLYAQIFATGGSIQGTNVTAQDIVDGNLSLDALQKTLTQLQTLGQIDVQKRNDVVTQTENQYRGIVPGAPQDTSASASAPSKLPQDVQDKISGNLTFSPDGKTAYIPRSVWSTMGSNMDAILEEAKNEGFTLLIN